MSSLSTSVTMSLLLTYLPRARSVMAFGSLRWARRGIETGRGRPRRGLRGRGLAEKDLADVGSAANLAGRARDLDPSRDQNVGPVGHPQRLERLLLDQQHSRPRDRKSTR